MSEMKRKKQVISSIVIAILMLLLAREAEALQVSSVCGRIEVDDWGGSNFLTFGPYKGTQSEYNELYEFRHWVSIGGGPPLKMIDDKNFISSGVFSAGGGGWGSIITNNNGISNQFIIMFQGILNGNTPGMGFFQMNTNFANLTDQPLEITHYVYWDIDIGEGRYHYIDEDAIFENWLTGKVNQTDDGRTYELGTYFDVVPDHWEMDFFPSIRNKLDTAQSFIDLSDSTTPIGPGDITIAMQFNMCLGPKDGGNDQTHHIVALQCLDPYILILQGEGLPKVIPAPSALLLVGSGLSGVIGLRRKRLIK
jgi:hypothetical protein